MGVPLPASRRTKGLPAGSKDADPQTHCPQIPSTVAQPTRSLEGRMSSACQAGVLELIFKKKSRGLSRSQEKGSSDSWKGRGVCREQVGRMWVWEDVSGRDRVDSGRRRTPWCRAKPKKARSVLRKFFLGEALAAKESVCHPTGGAGLPKGLGDLGLPITLQTALAAQVRVEGGREQEDGGARGRLRASAFRRRLAAARVK